MPLLALCLGYFMTILDITIVNIALVDIKEHLSANVSRQVGGVIGVAILGTLVGNQQTFLSGMHLAFVIAGGVLVIGLLAAWVFVRTRQETPQM